MHISKKAISVLLSLLLVLPCWTLPAYADENASDAVSGDAAQVQNGEVDEGITVLEGDSLSEELPLGADNQTTEESDAEFNEDSDLVIQDSAEVLSFVYIDQALVAVGDEQQIAFALADEGAELQSAFIELRRGETGEVLRFDAVNIVGAAALFSLFFENSQVDAYLIQGFGYELEGEQHYVNLSPSDLLDASAALVEDVQETEELAAVEGIEADATQESCVYAFDVIDAQLAEDLEAFAEMSEDGAVALAIDESGDLKAFNEVEDAVVAADPEGTEEPAGDESVALGPIESLLAPKEAAYADSDDLVVAIDPGHGGSDSGACWGGLRESDLNLSIAKYCKEELDTYYGVRSFLTRTTDVYLGLSQRVDIAVKGGANVFVCLHCNSTGTGSAYGAEVWVPGESSWKYNETHVVGQQLGTKILDELTKLGLNRRGVYSRYCTNNARYPDGSLEDYYTVIATAREYGIPGIIVEHAFVDTYKSIDRSMLSSEANRKKLGIADATGIAKQYGLFKWSGWITPSTTDVMVGSPVQINFGSKAKTDGYAYNYVWKYGDSWEHWGSTVKDTGSMTGESSFAFTPDCQGTYHLWADFVDEKGETHQTEEIVLVVKDWRIAGVTVPLKAKVGDSVSFSPSIEGNTADLTYNYAWKYGEGWDLWGSTVKDTGKMTSAKLGSFTPTKPGTWHVWVDAKDSKGNTVTSDEVAIEVELAWSLEGLTLPPVVKTGASVSVIPTIKGNAAGFTYNYCWSHEGGWNLWGSTVKDTDKMTAANSGSFTPTKPGTWHVWVDVCDSYGNKLTSEEYKVVVNDGGWMVSGLDAPKSAETGQNVAYSPTIEGSASGLTYNYAWKYGTGWDLWGSTVKDAGKMTSATAGSFTPTKPGTWHVWVDAKDSKGNTVTSDEVAIEVELNWKLAGVAAQTSAKVGDSVSFSPTIEGSASGLTYNYAWRYGDGWGLWGSTVKDTGKMTAANSGSFKPTKPGTWHVWIDACDSFGNKVTSKEYAVDVAPFDWSIDGVNVVNVGKIGQSVTFSPITSGDANGLTYNYCWSYEGGWSLWGSTVKDTGKMTSAMSGSFTPSKEGTWHVWIDACDPSGNKMTSSEFKVVVNGRGWALAGVDVPKVAEVGQSVSFAAQVDGDDSGLTYNYCWSHEGGWSLWGSTVKDTGKMTSETSGSFVPSKAGAWHVWIDVCDSQGNKVTSEECIVTVPAPGDYAIMGPTQTSVEKMVLRYNSIGRTYPSAMYTKYGAASINDFCRILDEEAKAEGVRSEVLFAQVMVETGWLQFGGQVLPEQCNFGGIGAVDGGGHGAYFNNYGTNSVRMGLRAQVQHLKCYACTDALKNSVVDPRWAYVTRGVAPTVRALQGRWASSQTYGDALMNQINALLAL